MKNNPVELNIELKYAVTAEIQNENGKKKLTATESYNKDDFLSEDGLIKLLKNNIGGLWNATEKEARNKVAVPVVIRASYKKVNKDMISEVVVFRKDSEQKTKLYSELVSCKDKEEFMTKAKQLINDIKETSYIPQMLITLANFSMNNNNFIGFFSHPIHGGWQKENKKIMRVKKALREKFQKAFIFPYFIQSTKKIDQTKLKYKDNNSQNADYMYHALGIQKHFNPDDFVHQLAKEKNMTLDKMYSKIKETGNFTKYTDFTIRDGDIRIKLNLESLKKRVKFVTTEKGKKIEISVKEPKLVDHRKKDISNMIEFE